MSRTINPQEFKSIHGNPNLTVIAVRRKNDYTADNAAIPGAMAIAQRQTGATGFYLATFDYK